MFGSIPVNHDRQDHQGGTGFAFQRHLQPSHPDADPIKPEMNEDDKSYQAEWNSNNPSQPRVLGKALDIPPGSAASYPSQYSSEDTAMERDHRVGELARQLTRQSSKHAIERSKTGGSGVESQDDGSDFVIEKDSELDPFSPNFSAKAWTRRMIGITSRDPERHPKRTAGVAFKNLKVFGYGSDTGFQQTVGNIPYAAFGAARDFILGRRRKVDILKGFDGLLDAGDMLVVLGPPGRWV